MFKAQLNDLINELTLALQDAEKFDSGNDTAGKRLRAIAQETKAKLHKMRSDIQQERNSRKG